MEKIKCISPELKNWIVNTLEQGVKPEAIFNGLVKKGFDETFAFSVLFRLAGNKQVDAGELKEVKHEPYVYETPEIGRKGNIIRTSDREITVALRVEKPFILYLENVLSDEECDQLIEMSRDRLNPNEIYDPKTGKKTIAPGRTSKGAYYAIGENEFIAKIEKRFAELTGLPVENGEGLQVLNYQIGEEYKPHFDYFPKNQVDDKKGGNRIATLLVYLNDVEEGGETEFPRAGLSVVPRKGSAVYFHYGNSKGQSDRLSVHSSVPVKKGEKWAATKWIRESNIYSNFKQQ